MPSVEYNNTALVWEEQTETVTDPDTGETTTVTNTLEKRPFEVRVGKWLVRDGDYQLHGFGNVTDFGELLASQTDTYAWLTSNYQTDTAVDETVVSEWVQGVSAVRNAQLDAILNFGNVTPLSTGVTDTQPSRFNFIIVLEGATVFDIDWLSVDFDPSRSGS
jgi:hypothetical protein